MIAVLFMAATFPMSVAAQTALPAAPIPSFGDITAVGMAAQAMVRTPSEMARGLGGAFVGSVIGGVPIGPGVFVDNPLGPKCVVSANSASGSGSVNQIASINTLILNC